MLTLNSLITHFCDEGKLTFEGIHYRDKQPVYTGDLWRLWPSPDGLESKNQNRLTSLASRKGIQIRFYDETITDEDGRVHEENPGYYGQVATFKVIGCSVWAEDEAQDNPAAYIDALLAEDELGRRSDRWLTDEQLTEQGFIRFDYDAESGFHPGQNDTPDSVVERLKWNRPAAQDFIFQIDDVGQFDIHFHLWYRLPESEE